MSNKLAPAPAATEPRNAEQLTIAFQDFNGVFIAKVSNLRDRETHAYGETRALAEANALRNYRTKYSILNGQNN